MSDFTTGHAAVHPRVTITPSALPFKLEYSAAEFAPLVGISLASLRKPKYWRRYGGRKRGKNVVFSHAAAQAIADGRK